MSSKIRMVLAGLTAAALITGVVAADPADAGKRKKKRAKAKSSKVVQVSKGGKAKAGNGGSGGKGGSSGNVHNTGNVGVGTPGTPATGPGVGVTEEMADCVAGLLGVLPGIGFFPGPNLEATVEDFFEVLGFSGEGGPPGCGPLPEAFTDCLVAAVGPEGVPGQFLTLLPTDLPPCLAVTPGTPAVPGGSGSVFSGNGGAGADGGAGGDAYGGDAGDNTNTSTVTVTRDDHSIDVDD